MFKRIATAALTVSLGFAPAALAAGPSGPDFGPTAPDFGPSAPDFGPGDIAATVIKHRVQDKIPEGPRADKMGPSVCVSRVMTAASEGFETCKSEWSMGCIYGGFEMFSKAMTVCTTDFRD